MKCLDFGLVYKPLLILALLVEIWGSDVRLGRSAVMNDGIVALEFRIVAVKYWYSWFRRLVEVAVDSVAVPDAVSVIAVLSREYHAFSDAAHSDAMANGLGFVMNDFDSDDF